GAGLGVMAAAYVGFRTTSAVSEVGLGATGPPALFGALAALGLTYLFSQRRGFIDPPSLLLVGVIVGVMAASLTQFIQYLMPDRGMSAGRWLLGAIGDDISWRQSAMVGAVVVAVAIVTGRLGPWMDAATLGDDEARSVGVRLGWLRSWLFTGSAVLAASAVVLAGPIAFVGLICPHLVRLAAGPSHRALIVGSAMAGGALVVWADTMVRTIELPSGRLPISVLTSLIGGPLLIVILRRREPLA
ncbi:MAG TPA: iron ABC transporter permease, partial [Phycisphaerales bacterium]|nr:iron ABC transporter permease [Phycisphaerales bacterium]